MHEQHLLLAGDNPWCPRASMRSTTWEQRGPRGALGVGDSLESVPSAPATARSGRRQPKPDKLPLKPWKSKQRPYLLK